MDKEKEIQKEIPKGKLKRSGVVGAAAAKAGLKKAGYLSKKPFLSDEKKNEAKERNDEDIAKMIFKALSSLKGTALKAAQLLSLEIEMLPQAYQKELARAASRVPPINRALIRKVISTELGAPPEKIFRSFESTPFAAASLGQVHRAVTFNGDDVAVKVQYPGVADAVKSDIDMMKGLIKLTPYARHFSGVMSVLEERITEELDYEKEAHNTDWFRENLDFSQVLVPEVFRELSSKRVLTTTRIDGLHLEEWLETGPSQDLRNYYGQLLVDVFTETVYNKKFFHADPNLGNYLFRDDKKLGIIDFGCVERCEMDLSNSIEDLIDSFEKKDLESILKYCESMGIFFRKDLSDPKFRDFLTRWIGWVTFPYKEKLFDYGGNKEYFQEGMEIRMEYINFAGSLEGSFIFFGRSEYGLYRMLQKLEAQVSMIWT
ncbi:MAG: AarF/ABC1/UbiB kinase family protein [bacterium]|nr:AarF/ABC1/UbiB kinase family protein [bacterium]